MKAYTKPSIAIDDDPNWRVTIVLIMMAIPKLANAKPPMAAGDFLKLSDMTIDLVVSVDGDNENSYFRSHELSITIYHVHYSVLAFSDVRCETCRHLCSAVDRSKIDRGVAGNVENVQYIADV